MLISAHMRIKVENLMFEPNDALLSLFFLPSGSSVFDC